jgi:capsid protein
MPKQAGKTRQKNTTPRKPKAAGKQFAAGDFNGRPVRLVVSGAYDAATNTTKNAKQWLRADALSADASAPPATRRMIRNRARYEAANNAFCRGIISTLANDMVGPGPTLQMLSESPNTNDTIEREFAAWAKAINLDAKLRTMRQAKAVDGEAFAMLVTNPKVAHVIKLDLVIIEADQVATPKFTPASSKAVDGIVFDEYGNPETYHVLREHPGGGLMPYGEYDPVPATQMIHWFRQDRPGQRRGVSELVASLYLFGAARQYRQAVLDAARNAANLATLFHTDIPAGGEAAEVPGLQTMEIDPSTAMFLPDGWQPETLRSEQPTTTYTEYNQSLVAESARPFNMPKNVALCDSSEYNYASGRLDHQTYDRSLGVEQGECDHVVLDKILAAWTSEAVLIDQALAMYDSMHRWFWRGREHVDPVKEANAQEKRLANNTTTLAAEYGRRGMDWEKELRQRAKEIALMRELGLDAEAADNGDSDDAIADAVRDAVDEALAEAR